jgi:molybdopterin-guanine dinucleotide biosynthesis protein A
MPIDGVPAVVRISRVLAGLTGSRMLVGGHDRYAHLDLDARWVPDVEAGAGPLGGIISGLAQTDTEFAYVLACDTPLVRPRLLTRLHAERTDDCHAVVPRHAGGVEPLVALYARRALPLLEAASSAGERAVHRVLAGLRVVYVDEEALRAEDPDLSSFVNVNTEADLQRIAKLTVEPGDDTL